MRGQFVIPFFLVIAIFLFQLYFIYRSIESLYFPEISSFFFLQSPSGVKRLTLLDPLRARNASVFILSINRGVSTEVGYFQVDNDRIIAGRYVNYLYGCYFPYPFIHEGNLYFSPIFSVSIGSNIIIGDPWSNILLINSTLVGCSPNYTKVSSIALPIECTNGSILLGENFVIAYITGPIVFFCPRYTINILGHSIDVLNCSGRVYYFYSVGNQRILCKYSPYDCICLSEECGKIVSTIKDTNKSGAPIAIGETIYKLSIQLDYDGYIVLANGTVDDYTSCCSYRGKIYCYLPRGNWKIFVGKGYNFAFPECTFNTSPLPERYTILANIPLESKKMYGSLLMFNSVLPSGCIVEGYSRNVYYPIYSSSHYVVSLNGKFSLNIVAKDVNITGRCTLIVDNRSSSPGYFEQLVGRIIISGSCTVDLSGVFSIEYANGTISGVVLRAAEEGYATIYSGKIVYPSNDIIYSPGNYTLVPDVIIDCSEGCQVETHVSMVPRDSEIYLPATSGEFIMLNTTCAQFASYRAGDVIVGRNYAFNITSGNFKFKHTSAITIEGYGPVTEVLCDNGYCRITENARRWRFLHNYILVEIPEDSELCLLGENPSLYFKSASVSAVQIAGAILYAIDVYDIEISGNQVTIKTGNLPGYVIISDKFVSICSPIEKGKVTISGALWRIDIT